MKKLTLIIAVLFTSLISYSQTEWRLAGENGSGDKFFVDTDVRSDNGNVVSAWVKVEYKKYTTDKGKYSLQKYEFNVDRKQYRILAIYFYNKADKLIDHAEWDDYESDWSYTAPESVGEFLLLAANYFFRKTNKVQ